MSQQTNSHLFSSRRDNIHHTVQILTGVVFTMLAVSTVMPSTAADRAPNILYIISDNQPTAIMGTYGNPDVKTPNLDKLAAQGIRFDGLFAVNGMCSPTRATIMTGLMPSQHGVHNWLEDRQMDNWPANWNAINEFRTLPHTLHDAGYQTGLIGKWHLGQPRKPPSGIDHWITFLVGHTVDFWDNTVIDNGNEYKVEGQHIVDFFTDKAVSYLDAVKNDKPFFLMVTYDGPYLNPPTNMGPARNRYFEEYQKQPLTSFPVQRINESILQQISGPDPGDDYRTAEQVRNHFMYNYLRMNADQDTRANIASQNTLVDAGVGRLLEALKRNNLENNTIVIYTTDQGNFYGQHGFWGHVMTPFPSRPYDVAMNIPLIIRYPDRVPAGTINSDLIGQYDLAPTILELAGVTDVVFEDSPGESFAILLTPERKSAWRDAVYFEQEETRAIRTHRYAYWKRLEGTGTNALFDLEKDPEQLINVYEDPSYNHIVGQLDARLVDFFARYKSAEYDLWLGGTIKGSVPRPWVYRELYGQDWQPTTEVKPSFYQ